MGFLGIMICKYPPYRAYIRISPKGTLGFGTLVGLVYIPAYPLIHSPDLTFSKDICQPTFFGNYGVIFGVHPPSQLTAGGTPKSWALEKVVPFFNMVIFGIYYVKFLGVIIYPS